MISIIEGKHILTAKDFHREIKVALDLPDFYGKNLDALWDCLTGFVELPLILVWKDYQVSKSALGGYASRIVALFEEANAKYGGIQLRLE